MLTKDRVPMVRAKLRSDGSLSIPKNIRKMLAMQHKDEVVIGVFEILKHGDISEMPSFSVSFG